MISEFALEGKKYVIMPKEEHDKLLILASKNEQLTRLFSFYDARKKHRNCFGVGGVIINFREE